MKGRSLYGNFSLKSKPKTFTETFTAEARVRLLDGRAAIVFHIGSGMESLTFRIGTKDAPECGYSAAETDGIEYSGAEGPIVYSAAEARVRLLDGRPAIVFHIGSGMESLTLRVGTKDAPECGYSGTETDGIEYSVAEEPVSYSGAGTDPGNIVIHKWLGGEETASLDDEMIAIPPRTWLHVAAVSTPDIIALYIGDKKIEFEKKSESAGPFALTLNPAKNEFNVDELLIDETAAVGFGEFAENTVARVPYAALDYREKWFVLEAQSPDKVKTNLFETEQFKAAVRAVIDSNTQGV
jgi:glutaredoxin-related protein